MSSSQKRPSPFNDATSAPAAAKKAKILTTPSGIALPQKHWFDPWNSSSTGHQRAENNLASSTSWRESRNHKLSAQYQGGRGGGKRLYDTVGAGSENFGKDGRKANGSWRDGAKGLREKNQPGIQEFLGPKRTNDDALDELHSQLQQHRHEDDDLERAIEASLQEQSTQTNAAELANSTVGGELAALSSIRQGQPCDDLERAIAESMQDQLPASSQDDIYSIPPSNQTGCSYLRSTSQELGVDDAATTPKQIFQHLVFYINGSTAPLISDHKLKYLISSHGGSMSVSHLRKAVTHVIIGNPHNHLVRGNGAGGALAGSKIQKEIARTRGKGVKFVNVQWVLDSVKAGTRRTEAKYGNVKLGGSGQSSVFEKFKVAKPGVGTIVGKDTEDIKDEELGLE